jgi:hypothetical protein
MGLDIPMADTFDSDITIVIMMIMNEPNGTKKLICVELD